MTIVLLLGQHSQRFGPRRTAVRRYGNTLHDLGQLVVQPACSSGFDEAACCRCRIGNMHRQPIADRVHLRRTSGTEITITAMMPRYGRVPNIW